MTTNAATNTIILRIAFLIITLERSTVLSKKIETPANFVCCNVLETSKHITETFDIVFSSYGTIGWLPDLKPWGKRRNFLYRRVSSTGLDV